MFAVLLLFLPLQSLGQPQCGEFTTNDMEGPFYEVVKSEVMVSKNFLLSQMPQIATNWPHKTSSMTQEKQLFWKDRWIYPDTYIYGIYIYPDT